MEEEKDILRRVSGGDSDAFRLIFLKYAPRVEAFAMKMLKNIHEAQDVSQNIFTKLWMQRSELAGVRSLNAYLFRMTRQRRAGHLQAQPYPDAVREQRPGRRADPLATTLRNVSIRPNCRA